MNLINKFFNKFKTSKSSYVQTDEQNKNQYNTMAKKNTNNENEMSAAENVKALLSAENKTNAEKIASVKEFINSLNQSEVEADDFLNNLRNAAFNPADMDIDKIAILNALIA